MTRVVVVGGGIAGLTVAWAWKAKGAQVTVLEGSPDAGGVLGTDHHGPWLFERAAQTMRGGHGVPHRLIHALGLGEQVVVSEPGRPALLHQGKVAPLSPWGVVAGRPLSCRATWRALREPWIPPVPNPEETVDAFLRRRLGDGVADTLGGALLGGVTGGDPKELEVGGVFPAWVEAERRGGLFRGRAPADASAPRRPWTLRPGWQALVDALVSAVEAVHYDTQAVRIDADGPGWVVFARGGSFEADHVVLAAPPSAAADLVGGDPTEFPTHSLASVHLGFEDAKKRRGFGWLADPRERTDALGILWVSDILPHTAPPGHRLVRVMMGGGRHPDSARGTDAELIAAAQRVLQEVEGVTGPPVVTHVRRVRIPQATRGHHGRLRALAARAPGIHWLGWGTHGPGLVDTIVNALAAPAQGPALATRV